jgi:hypothetical protein
MGRRMFRRWSLALQPRALLRDCHWTHRSQCDKRKAPPERGKLRRGENAGNGASKPALNMCPTAPGASNTFLWRSEPGCCNPGENTKGVGVERRLDAVRLSNMRTFVSPDPSAPARRAARHQTMRTSGYSSACLMRGARMDREVPRRPSPGTGPNDLADLRLGLANRTLDGRFYVRRRRQDGGCLPLLEAAGGAQGHAKRPGSPSARRRLSRRRGAPPARTSPPRGATHEKPPGPWAPRGRLSVLG